MKKTPLALGLYILGLSCIAAPAAAPKVVIVGKSKVPPGKSFLINASGSVSDKPLVWSFKGPDVPIVYFAGEEGKGKVFAYVDDPVSGVYTFKVKAKGVPEGQTEMDADVDTWTIVVEDPAPPPPPPPVVDPVVPPGPPLPPVPISQVTDKLRVLFLYETSEPVPIGPYESIRSADVRSYLNTHTMVDGKNQAWRMWDKDIVATGDTPGWQAALKTALAKVTPSAQGVPFTPTMFAFKDAELLDTAPIGDAATTLEFLRRFGGR